MMTPSRKSKFVDKKGRINDFSNVGVIARALAFRECEKSDKSPACR